MRGSVLKPVTVVGSINLDLINYLDRWPKVGETIAVRETANSLGGKGANQAAAAALLGADVTMLGATGKDSFGEDVRQQLEAKGVKTQLAEYADVSTGMAFIDVAPDGSNIIRLAGGANNSLSAGTIRENAAQIEKSSVLLLQNEISLETSLEAARIARKAGVLVIMDPAPAPVPAWGPETFTCFDIMTPNAEEAGAILGTTPQTLEEAQDAARALKAQGLKGAIITMGGMGAAWAIDAETGALPAPRVKAIDTVAAGDCFNGALATRLAEGESFEAAIRFAMHAAAIATTRKGASSSLPSREEVLSFLSSTGG